VYGAIAATLAAFIVGGGVGWLARGAAAAPSPFQAFTVHAIEAHRLYVVEGRHPVEVPGSERSHLQQWLTKRCGWVVRAPELTGAGLKLVGGRLLPSSAGPASFMMYESASGERFTIYTAKSEAEATQMRFAAEGKESTLFWADDGVVYAVVSTGVDRGRLTQVAQAIYDQMEKKGG
jgi:anti-sigma factor RsiW